MQVERKDHQNTPNFPFLGWNTKTGTVILIQAINEHGRYTGVVVSEATNAGDSDLKLGMTRTDILTQKIEKYPGTISLKN